MKRVCVVWPPGVDSPDACGDAPVAVHEASQRWVCADASLDYRDDLARRLDIQLSPTLRDVDLILAAHTKWGVGFAARLEGDFSCVLWDGRSGRLLLARDVFGSRPLFFSHGRGAVVAGSRIEDIHTHNPDVGRLSRPWLADCLEGRYERWRTETVWTGIGRVPPGTTHICDRNGSTQCAVTELTPRRDVPLSLEASAEAFRDVFQASVRSRCGRASNLGVWLSGGLDSAAVACEAVAQSRHTSAAVWSQSATFDAVASADEREYLDAVAAFCPTLRQRRLNGDTAWGFAVVGGRGHPDIDSLRALIDRLAHAAASDRCDIVLTGLWADQVLLSDAYVHPELLRDMPLRLRLREFRYFRAARGWGRPELVVRALVHRQRRGEAVAGTLRDQLTSGIMAARVHAVWEACADAGVTVRFPFLDKRVVETVMAMPPWLLFGGGEIKQLAKRAFSGLVPAQTVARRQSHGHFSDLEVLGFQRERARLWAWTHDSRTVDLGLMSARRLKQAWESADRSRWVPSQLSRWVLVEGWLRGLDNSRRAPTVEVPGKNL